MYRYTKKVRGTLYLWGSAGITKNIPLTAPLLLHIRNDQHGEAVTIGTVTTGGNQSTIGTLDAGECATIEVKDICGVTAQCALDSCVSCAIEAR